MFEVISMDNETELKDRLEELNERRDEIEDGSDSTYDEFENMLDETHGEISICGVHMYASEVLKEHDPIAYSESYKDYFDEELTEIINEIADIEQEIKDLSD